MLKVARLAFQSERGESGNTLLDSDIDTALLKSCRASTLSLPPNPDWAFHVLQSDMIPQGLSVLQDLHLSAVSHFPHKLPHIWHELSPIRCSHIRQFSRQKSPRNFRRADGFWIRTSLEQVIEMLLQNVVTILSSRRRHFFRYRVPSSRSFFLRNHCDLNLRRETPT